MRITVNVGTDADRPPTLSALIEGVRAASRDGFDTAWLPQIPPWEGFAPWDALTVAALAGSQVPDIKVGTAVVAAYTHHPFALAGQALSAQAAAGGRLTLGIGTSHKAVIEGVYGHSFAKPAAFLREYLQVLMPVLHGEAVEHVGPALTANGRIRLPGVEAPSVVVAALGPQMLRLAGELADGTVVAFAGLRTVSEHIVPRITKAASDAARPAPRVIARVIAGVTSDPDAARTAAVERFKMVMTTPSYRAMLEIEGTDNVADVVALGDESFVEAELRRYEAAGATEIIAVPFGTPEEKQRTNELFISLAR